MRNMGKQTTPHRYADRYAEVRNSSRAARIWSHFVHDEDTGSASEVDDMRRKSAGYSKSGLREFYNLSDRESTS